MARSEHDRAHGSLRAGVVTAADDFAAMPPFEVRSSAEQRVPFVFNSPHSGRYYPERFLEMARGAREGASGEIGPAASGQRRHRTRHQREGLRGKAS